MTSLKDLQKSGGFVSDKSIVKHIKFAIDDDDYEADIHVKPVGIYQWEAIRSVNGDGEMKPGWMARMICECVTLGDKGDEEITLDDAKRLHPNLAAAMIEAVTEVNEGKKP